MEKNDKRLTQNSATSEELQTRQAVRTARTEAQNAEKKAAKRKKAAPEEDSQPLFNPFFGYKKRRFPIWQRLIALISLCAIALVLGAMFGYGGLGHRSPWAVFQTATWQHIFDFLKTN
ncbi:DNA-directed RNA polymerase subunit beta [Sporolactobacillus kofuensis]|uniref:DNA-directed RNA polymerase subunit beta n=1 Tax=Sporolactobacillus kofuensis TaxID=269672 RepID=A0ABW1WFS1_9BACL|nr:DNA-directed RNA polymerase subunit beta [Sporolactobacillus kofuensis]MCO7175848.1 DNA-directed RNA polymerase subunit beta [Sporolactobacillus kofuensis]